jgi:hypothetical protein
MKIVYAGAMSIATGSELADAVLAYGLALTRAHQFDLVEVPFLDDRGEKRRASIVLGGGSLSSIECPTVGAELREPSTLADVQHRITRLDPPWLLPQGDGEHVPVFED